MKLKFDENNHVVVENGMPVYVHDDGKEIAFDAVQATQKISQLNAECKSHREAKEKAEAELKKFDGIDDVEKAKKALETVKNLDDKTLIDAGEAEKVKAEVIKLYEEKLAAKEVEVQSVKDALNEEVIGGAFARSTFIAEKMAIPVDMVQAYFGKHFSLENGKIMAKDAFGHQILSRTKVGEIADFEEAIEQIVSAYPQKDHILKGSGNQGGGANGSNGSSGIKNPWSKAHWNMTDQAKIFRESPEKARALAQQAGVKVNF